MASFLASEWDITPEMEAELDRIQAEEPLPDPDDENDQSADTADGGKDSPARD